MALFALLLGSILLLLLEAWLLHSFNHSFRIKHSTYFHCLVIIFVTAIVGGLFQIAQYAQPDTAFLWWGSGLMVTSLIAYAGYWFYFRTPFIRFIMVWALTLCVSTAGALLLLGVGQLYVVAPYVVQDDAMAPAYKTGDYVYVELVDHTPRVGDVVLVELPLSAQTATTQLFRVNGLGREAVGSTTVPSDSLYVANDQQPETSGHTIPRTAVLGKPIFNLGRL